jgi:hypothetical protein
MFVSLNSLSCFPLSLGFLISSVFCDVCDRSVLMELVFCGACFIGSQECDNRIDTYVAKWFALRSVRLA